MPTPPTRRESGGAAILCGAAFLPIIFVGLLFNLSSVWWPPPPPRLLSYKTKNKGKEETDAPEEAGQTQTPIWIQVWGGEGEEEPLLLPSPPKPNYLPSNSFVFFFFFFFFFFFRFFFHFLNFLKFKFCFLFFSLFILGGRG